MKPAHAFNMSCCLVFALTASASPTADNVPQTSANSVHSRALKIDCKKPEADLDLIKKEMSVAQSMADYAVKNLQPDSVYFTSFVSKDLRDIADNAILDQVKDVYAHASKILDAKGTKEYDLIITCDDKADMCTKGYYASMSDSKKTINLCDKFFKAKDEKEELRKSEDILTTCKKEGHGGLNTMQDFWHSKAMGLLHEVTHTKYVMQSSAKALDYAYGVQNCVDLAHGSYKVGEDREFVGPDDPLCADFHNPALPGYCPPSYSISNADSLAILAGATWWSGKEQCNFPIAVPGANPKPPGRRSLHIRSDDDSKYQFDQPVTGIEDSIHGRAFHTKKWTAKGEQRHRYIFGGYGLKPDGSDFKNAFRDHCRGVAEDFRTYSDQGEWVFETSEVEGIAGRNILECGINRVTGQNCQSSGFCP